MVSDLNFDIIALGERIKEERKKLKLSQEKLSEEADISLTFAGEIERGEKLASVGTLVKIAKALGVSLDYLVFGNPEGKTLAQIDKLNTLLRNRSDKEIRIVYDIAKALLKNL